MAGDWYRFLRIGFYGTVLIGTVGGSAALDSAFNDWRSMELQPYIQLFERRIEAALDYSHRRPDLRQTIQGEILENIIALNELDK